MKFKHLLFAILSLVTVGLSACGSGGAGLNGGITFTAPPTVNGSRINATVTYTNPTQTNVIGVLIDLSYQVGNQAPVSLGTQGTNNSGSIGVSFTPLPAFNGSQTVTVIAKTGNLTNFASVLFAGNTLTVTPPLTLALTTTLAGGTAVPFVLPPSSAFVAITDPFTNNVNGHPITITAVAVKNNPADTLLQPNATATNSAGTALFPGDSGTLITPSTISGIETMTITWTVTDTITGQTGTGITTVTLTKTS